MKQVSAIAFFCAIILTTLVACDQSGTKISSPVQMPKANLAEMVLIPGGQYEMGGDAGEMDGDSHSHQSAYPIHKVDVDAFWMDETEVTNEQFNEFVTATGYVTFAAKPLPPQRVAELKQLAETSIAGMQQAAEVATGEERESLLASIERVKEASKDLEMAGSMVFAAPKGELNCTATEILRSGGKSFPGRRGVLLEGSEHLGRISQITRSLT